MKQKKGTNQFEVTDVCKNEKKGTFSQIKYKKKKITKTSSFIVCDQGKDYTIRPKLKPKNKETNHQVQIKQLDSINPIKPEVKQQVKSFQLDNDPNALQSSYLVKTGFTKMSDTKLKKEKKLRHNGRSTLGSKNGPKSCEGLVYDKVLKKSNCQTKDPPIIVKTDEIFLKILEDETSSAKDSSHNKLQKEKKRRNYDKDNKEEVNGKANMKPQMKKKIFNNRPTLDDTGFMWDLKLEDFDKLNEPLGKIPDDDEDDEQPSKSKKKKTKGEKLQEMKEEEARLRMVEQSLLEAENNPKTADQFDRALLAKPDKSDLWIKYIAHHLQATEIDKGRAVARRALQTIGQRLDVERLNVWIALLNLENMFGTQESLKNTLDEALRTNDEFTVYSKMLNIYTESKKSQETEQLVSVMLRKFRSSPKCWLDCCAALMNINLPDKARNLVQRAISALPNKEHVNLLCKFALMENQHGFSDQSQTLFEHILTSYPKRTDIWNVYVDMLTKSNKITVARQILERACRQKLPPRNMKMLFSKWLSFEEKHGNPEKVEHVKKQAEAYVGSLTKKLE